MQDTAIIYYDQYCRLCHGSLRFIERRVREGRFQFRPLQTEAGRRVAAAAGLDPNQPGSLVLSVNDTVYVRSAAVVRIGIKLRFPWLLLGAAWLIPLPLRDAVYTWVARHRYRWFGTLNIPSDPVDHEVDKQH